MPNYYESTDHQAALSRADGVPVHERIERWDSEPNFLKLDSWTQEQLCDDVRFAHYLTRKHLEKPNG